MNNNVNIKKYNLQDKKNLVLKIEGLGKLEQVEIFKIIKTETNYYTENVNGIFINMSILNTSILEEMKEYIDYVSLQQSQLNEIEKDKERYKKEFYKDNKAVAI